ncbi:hypothetical protein RBI22_17175 [Alcaligenaceae bacterium C4P045]|nr:hypothetical protein [Alcaligenaceae bacterium C4P045]
MMFIARAMTALSAFRRTSVNTHAATPARAIPEVITLPPVKALFLCGSPPGARRRLIDVGRDPTFSAQGTASDLVSTPHPPRDARYEVCTLHPSVDLVRLAAVGAQFDLSRLGQIQVWQAGVVVAAQSPSDCLALRCRHLCEDEAVYLAAYLRSIGRRWNDPDQRAACIAMPSM